MDENDIQTPRRAEARRENGFTLIELLVVIVVLGVLSAVVVFALSGVTGQSQAAACNSDAASVETAVTAYQTTGATLAAISNGVTSSTGQSQLVGTYLKTWPTTTNGYAIGVDASGNVDVTNTKTQVMGIFDGTSGVTGVTGVTTTACVGV